MDAFVAFVDEQVLAEDVDFAGIGEFARASGGDIDSYFRGQFVDRVEADVSAGAFAFVAQASGEKSEGGKSGQGQGKT